jgi:hypothetical protein
LLLSEIDFNIPVRHEEERRHQDFCIVIDKVDKRMLPLSGFLDYNSPGRQEEVAFFRISGP